MKLFIKVIAPFIFLIMGLIFENAFNSEFYDNHIKPIIHFDIQLYVVILVSYVVLLFFQSYDSQKKLKISDYEQEILQYKQDLSQETKGLWKQFHDLNRFNQQEIIHRIMKAFVDNQNNVMAIQMYDYTFKEGNKSTDIKVTHQNGYVCEGETLNALLQENYSIPRRIFRRYKVAIDTIGRNNGIKLIKFINDYKMQLDAISYDDLKGKANFSIIYSLMLVGVQTFFYYYNNQLTYNNFTVDLLQDEQKDQILNNNKRTGVFRGILNRELVGGENYIFFHTGDNTKKGRIYFTKGIKINGNKCIFLVTLFNNINQNDVLSKVNEFSDELVDLLKNGGLTVDENY